MDIKGVKVHKAVNENSVLDAVERYRSTLDNPGFCIACGCEAMGVEPDAEEYECEACGESAVYGAEELLIYLMFNLLRVLNVETEH